MGARPGPVYDFVGRAAGGPRLQFAGEDRSADPEEPLRIYAELAGHPFCILVADAPTA
jgi:hypothetical protein